MDGKALELVNWRLHRLARRLSWPVAVALGLAAFDLAFCFSTVQPALEQRAAMRAEASRAHAAAAETAIRSNPPRNPEVELASFYAALPKAANAPDLLRRLHRAAETQGLVLEKAEYRPLPDPGGRLTRYQILLPARGTYPEVRRFLAQAGREVPGLSLDGITFQRQQIGDEALEAQIKLTLFLEAKG
jgi:Tfp pilus assembly protein PilO